MTMNSKSLNASLVFFERVPGNRTGAGADRRQSTTCLTALQTRHGSSAALGSARNRGSNGSTSSVFRTHSQRADRTTHGRLCAALAFGAAGVQPGHEGLRDGASQGGRERRAVDENQVTCPGYTGRHGTLRARFYGVPASSLVVDIFILAFFLG